MSPCRCGVATGVELQPTGPSFRRCDIARSPRRTAANGLIWNFAANTGSRHQRATLCAVPRFQVPTPTPSSIGRRPSWTFRDCLYGTVWHFEPCVPAGRCRPARRAAVLASARRAEEAMRAYRVVRVTVFLAAGAGGNFIARARLQGVAGNAEFRRARLDTGLSVRNESRVERGEQDAFGAIGSALVSRRGVLLDGRLLPGQSTATRRARSHRSVL